MKGANPDEFTPLEIVVNKILEQGYELESLYHQLDGNGDGALTVREIRDGIMKMKIDLTSREIQEIVDVLDKNTDGLVSLEEFVDNLGYNISVRREYKQIMGDLENLPNPIVLEERTLDLRIRKKLLADELKKSGLEMDDSEQVYQVLLNKLKSYESLSATSTDPGTAEQKQNKMQSELMKLKVKGVCVGVCEGRRGEVYMYNE